MRLKIFASMLHIAMVVIGLLMSVSFVHGGSDMVEFVQSEEFSVANPERDAGAFAWSPDGTKIAVMASMLRKATVFSISDGRVVGTISNLAGSVYAINFAADGRVIVPTHDGSVAAFTLWDLTTGQIESVTGPDPDGDSLSNTLDSFVLDVNRSWLAGLHLLIEGEGKVFRIAVYDAKTWHLQVDHAISAKGLAISPDGSRIAAIGRAGQVSIINLQTGAVLLQFQANMNDVERIAWSADGQRLATGTMSDGFGLNQATGKYEKLHDDDVLQIWNASTGTRIAAARTDIGGGVESLDFSSNGKWLVTTTSDGTCRLWSSSGLDQVQILATGLHPTTAMTRFSPDSSRIAVIRKGLAHATIYSVK